MSHLFVGKKKKIFISIKIVSFLIIFFLFINGIINYSGNKFIYLSFTLIYNFLIIFSLRKNSIFFETFFGVLLWLGFWFKFTCTISFTDGVFREGIGEFNYTNNSFDDVLLISQIGALSLIFSSFLREKFIFKYPKKIFLNTKNESQFFLKQRYLIWSIFLIFFILISVINFYFKIYQKGLIPIYDINFFLSGTIKWLLLFGLASISTLIIYFEAKFLKKFFLLSSIIIYLETFFSSISMLSRGMIFNAFALMYGIYKFSKKLNLKQNVFFYIKSLIFIFIFFYISITSVNYIRANFFYVGKSIEIAVKKDVIEKKDQIVDKKYATFSQHNSEILYLLINRWVGIDGVMAVNSKEDFLGYKLILKSLKERHHKKNPTFYELEFNLETINYKDQLYENVKGNTLPGIIAYLFYSGSLYFLFFSLSIISLIASCIEYLAFRLSNQNLIFSCLIGNIIAYRLIHFGYLPHQTYLLFGAIFLTIGLFYFINLVVNKLNK